MGQIFQMFLKANLLDPNFKVNLAQLFIGRSRIQIYSKSEQKYKSINLKFHQRFFYQNKV